MPKIVCQSCGADVPEPGMYCSAGIDLVCQGRDFIPGCGEVLTAEERHWYGSSCENCEQAWSDRIGDWQNGAADETLEKLYGAPGRTHH